MRKRKNEELERLDVDQFKKTEKIPVCIILDNIRSLNNIGSVFRTSDAFLIEKIYLCGITARPPHKDIHKTALGATESVDWEYVEDVMHLLPRLAQNGYMNLAIEQAEGSQMIHGFFPKKTGKYALVFGNEVKGVQQQVVDECDSVLEIPQFGTKHSLNIAVSVGVVVWDFWSKLQK
ncbi:RNA methyltransferase [Maribacter sp. 4G9]|uniref:RNA methyltransferase n=1 Tax=Maribacter sp. 4G9 TaxID=1889777 RepID=UPI000C15249E|nr:RNA methyltransferase [Maribacter sp. 4G9]PIB28264.1 RNA methyltransferase [Maribacter sp. 4G9]